MFVKKFYTVLNQEPDKLHVRPTLPAYDNRLQGSEILHKTIIFEPWHRGGNRTNLRRATGTTLDPLTYRVSYYRLYMTKSSHSGSKIALSCCPVLIAWHL